VMVAADRGDSEALKVLLEAGANINCRVSENPTFYFDDHYLLRSTSKHCKLSIDIQH
jgi:ankyrin repeat protein